MYKNDKKRKKVLKGETKKKVREPTVILSVGFDKEKTPSSSSSSSIHQNTVASKPGRWRWKRQGRAPDASRG